MGIIVKGILLFSLCTVLIYTSSIISMCKGKKEITAGGSTTIVDFYFYSVLIKIVYETQAFASAMFLYDLAPSDRYRGPPRVSAPWIVLPYL